MIWSILKMALFVAIAAALAWGAAYVQDTPGVITFAFAGRERELTPLAFLIALLVLFVAFWLVIKLVGLVLAVLRFLTGDETALSRYFDKSRERRGYAALSDGMIALAAGDGARATARAAKADRLLARPELTRILAAQAAELSGDTSGAQEHYKVLLADKSTRYLGIVGLMKARLAANDTKAALQLAERAFALRPRDKLMQDTLFDLQIRAGHWGGARQTLRYKVKSGTLPRDVAQRREAVLLLGDAMKAHAAGDGPRARADALSANRAAPGLVPAAVLAAQVHAGDGNMRAATAALRKAWGQQPHPDLAAAWDGLADDADAQARIARFQPLLKLAPDHAESRILDCELQLAAEDFPAARRALGNLASTSPNGRVLSLMAAIVQGEGGEEHEVRAWLARALAAPRGETWVCESCNHLHAKWAPLCENCQGLDTLHWALPPEGSAAELSPSMLALLAKSQTLQAADEDTPLDAEIMPEDEEPEASDGAAPPTDEAENRQT